MQEDKEKQRKEKRKSDSEKQESDAESVITNVDETLNQPVKMPKTPEQTAPTEPITPRI